MRRRRRVSAKLAQLAVLRYRPYSGAVARMDCDVDELVRIKQLTGYLGRTAVAVALEDSCIRMLALSSNSSARSKRERVDSIAG
jgi:hypothetical protein